MSGSFSDPSFAQRRPPLEAGNSPHVENHARFSRESTLPATPPAIFVGEIPFRITALKTGMRESANCSATGRSASSETRSDIDCALFSIRPHRASNPKKRRVVVGQRHWLPVVSNLRAALGPDEISRCLRAGSQNGLQDRAR